MRGTEGFAWLYLSRCVDRAAVSQIFGREDRATWTVIPTCYRRGSLRRSISGERDRCGAGHRADGCLVTDEELHSTLEAQIALHRRARSDDDARNIVEYMRQPTGRFLNQNAAFHMRCAADVHAAVDRFDSTSHMRPREGDFTVHIRQRAGDVCAVSQLQCTIDRGNVARYMRAAAERNGTVHGAQRRGGRMIAQLHTAVHRRCTGDPGMLLDMNRAIDGGNRAGQLARRYINRSIDLMGLIAVVRSTASG